MEKTPEDEGPWEVGDGNRISILGPDGRQYYFYISEDEIIVFLPETAKEDPKQRDHYCVVTALSRMASKLLQLACDMAPDKKWAIVKKQLERSSLSSQDLPALMLAAILRWEKGHERIHS